jgi:hypothetical protein
VEPIAPSNPLFIKAWFVRITSAIKKRLNSMENSFDEYLTEIKSRRGKTTMYAASFEKIEELYRNIISAIDAI